MPDLKLSTCAANKHLKADARHWQGIPTIEVNLHYIFHHSIALHGNNKNIGGMQASNIESCSTGVFARLLGERR